MARRILAIKMEGFKNLEKPVEVLFENKILKEDFLKRPSIKAIYGTNGAGKSAFIKGFEVYQHFCYNDSYLQVMNWDHKFQELINVNLKRAFVSVVVLSDEGGTPLITRHEVHWKLEEGRLIPTSESLYAIGAPNWHSSKGTLLLQSDGKQLTFIHSMFAPIEDKLVAATTNALDRCSSLRFVGPVLADYKGAKPYVFSHISCIGFSKVILHSSEDQLLPPDSIIRLFGKVNSLGEEGIRMMVNAGGISLPDDEEIVLDSFYDAYKANVDKIASFIRVFKPSLLRIDIEKREAENGYKCRKKMVYAGGKVIDFSCESTAIKKLVRLYNALALAAVGGIVFIDEFDSDIHDVYFCALIEYFGLAAKGQLCYTTHNVSAMEILKGLPHALDFLENGSITSWKKNGNYSPVRLYHNGLIPNSPFNVSASDFVGVF